MLWSQQGNRRSGIALAMRQQTVWFIPPERPLYPASLHLYISNNAHVSWTSGICAEVVDKLINKTNSVECPCVTISSFLHTLVQNSVDLCYYVQNLKAYIIEWRKPYIYCNGWYLVALWTQTHIANCLHVTEYICACRVIQEIEIGLSCNYVHVRFCPPTPAV